MTRSYDMSTRARAAAATKVRILASAEALLGTVPVVEITLQDIAARAGVTVQTVLRHTGLREGCFAAVGERIGARVDAQRGRTAPGDIVGAISALIAHYEA